MSVELTYLTLSVALLFVLVLVQAFSAVHAQGPKAMATNRDDLPAPKPFQGRTKRMVDNLRENMLIFAPLVLIAAHYELSNFWTVLGAQLFFYARVGHAAFYIFGPQILRSLAWFVGVVGCVLIFLALFGVLQ